MADENERLTIKLCYGTPRGGDYENHPGTVPRPDREKTVVVSSEAQLLLHSEFEKHPTDWPPDGRFVLFENEDPQTGIDLWTTDLQSHKTSPVARTSDETEGRFAPDGKWLAYTSDESGAPEVYVQPFPRPGEKIQVSRGGGSAPEWRGDGKQLYYMSPESKLMAANVKTAPTFIVDAPQALFALPKHSQYEVAPDGRRFLVNAFVSGEARLYVVLNWTTGLKGK
jgi:eukaryotic-like serine/threonine-protein kinase